MNRENFSPIHIQDSYPVIYLHKAAFWKLEERGVCILGIFAPVHKFFTKEDVESQ